MHINELIYSKQKYKNSLSYHMFRDELHQLLQRDVCSYDPQQDTLVLLHQEIQNTDTTLDEICRNIHN